MALSLAECAGIVNELRDALVGGFLQKIHQPHPLTLTLDVRTPGRTSSLLICVEPRFARLHLISRKFENPPVPPAFCTFLRAYVEGGRIIEISQEPEDRIVYLTIQKAGQIFIFVIALTGNQANVHVLDEAKSVLRSLRDSRVKAGVRYEPPALRHRIQTESSTSAQPDDVRKNQVVEQKLGPSGQAGGTVPESFPRQEVNFEKTYPVSAALEARYEELEEQEANAHLLQHQLAHVRKSLKHANRKIQALEEDSKKTERFREYARYGELLKGQLQAIKKGQDTITLVDYYDPALPALTLPLNPSKDAIWNMEDYFKKYQKFVGAQEHLQPRVEQARQEVLRLEKKLTQLEQGMVEPDLVPRPQKRKGTPLSSHSHTAKKRPAPAQGYRTFTSADGLLILVGKTANDNDHLTFKTAKPDDLWLHARGTPGSHVIVRVEKGASVPPETLQDAATLTLWFSDLRKSGKGEVIYTLRKFVKKAKGQKPGAVMVDREKSVWIELKEERLTRLKEGTR
jgi:predicted ribosome quality control (RQC) complex YloA/Tae2 family protein